MKTDFLIKAAEGKARRAIAKYGQPLTVTRGPSVQGDATTITTAVYNFLPEHAAGIVFQAGNLNLEAGQNAGDDNPYDFVTDGNSDVRMNDLIGPYLGYLWRVVKPPNPDVFSNVVCALHCFAVIEKVAP